jgi:hypothetical protein
MRLLVEVLHHRVAGYDGGDIEKLGIGGFDGLIEGGGVEGEGMGKEFVIDLYISC